MKICNCPTFTLLCRSGGSDSVLTLLLDLFNSIYFSGVILIYTGVSEKKISPGQSTPLMGGEKVVYFKNKSSSYLKMVGLVVSA